MTGYDLFALMVVAVSSLAGWVRGGARELITLFSFLLAAILALIALPVTGPIGRDLVGIDWAGSFAAAVVSFLGIYILLRVLAAVVGLRLQQHEQLGGIDRAFGLGFGLVRALVLLGVIHLVFHAATPPERVPGWFRDALVFPVSEGAARAIQAVLPGIGRGADALTPVLADSARRGATDEPQSDDTAPAEPPMPDTAP